MKAKRIFSKSLALFLAVLMSVSVMAFTPFTVSAEISEDFILIVGGVQVTDENASDILGDGTASYDSVQNVLTLNNANITEAYVENGGFGIYSNSSLDICLVGENKIETPDDKDSTYGIFVYGDMNVSGESLIIKTGDAIITEESDTPVESFGVSVLGNLTVSGASVQSYSGNIQGQTGYESSAVGVYTEGNIEVKDDGYLAGFGGDISGDSEYALSCGVFAFGTEESLLMVLIRDGGITAEGGDVTSSYVAESIGINVFFGDVVAFVVDSYIAFVGGNATAVAEVVEGEETYETFAFSNGAYICGGSFAVDGGNINISSKTVNATFEDGNALVVESDFVNDDPFGGYVAINCDEVLLNPYSVGFMGTDVNIKSECGYAVAAELGIEVGENLEITTPTNGTVGDGDGWYFVIENEDGTVATDVVIEPFVYEVIIYDAKRTLSVLVPIGENINDIYCEKFNIDDFSQALITEKEGYVFEGWYTDEEFSAEFSFDDAVTSDITLYGKWTEVKDETSEDTSDDTTSDTSDTSDETSEDTSDDTTGDISDTSDETSEDASDDTIGDISDDTSVDASDDSSANGAAPGDNGTSVFFIVLAFSAVFALTLFASKKRA